MWFHISCPDVNYVVFTPDRRKDTQLVHVNLIKPYVEREKVDSQKFIHKL